MRHRFLFLLNVYDLQFAALTHGLVDEYASCYGYVERLDVSELWNGNPFIAQGEMLSGNALVFGTHHDAGGVGEGSFSVGVFSFLSRCHYAKTAVLKVFDGIANVGLAAYG